MTHQCIICRYVYDKTKGEPSTNTNPNTRFKDLPDTWRCPICKAQKNTFSPVKEEDPHADADTTVAEVIIAELAARGVTHFFGIPGASSLGIVDAIRKNNKAKYILMRHEENAAMAASAYNKLTGELAVCVTIAGPGASNLATGLYDAQADHASVVSLNGQAAVQFSGQGEFQGIDKNVFFRPITVFNNTIYDKKKTVELVTTALKYARIQKGVAQLSVPNTIQKELLNAQFCDSTSCIANFNISPEETEINKAVKLIDKAESPVIIAGWGAVKAAHHVLELAQKIKAPIVTTFRAKGILPDDTEWLLGILGNVGPPCTRTVVNDSDLLLVFGSSFSSLTNIPKDNPIIQVDINPLHIGKTPVTIGLWGNCTVVIPTLYEKVAFTSRPNVLPALKKMKQMWLNQLEKEADPHKTPVRPPYIMKVLSDTIPEDAVISIDVGENGWWFGRNFQMKRQKFIMSGYLATMGFGFPGALAAKLAYPDKHVFCITGDDGFAMAMADFVTAVKYNLSMVVVVLNNKQFGMQVEQKREYYPSFVTDFNNPDFAVYAEA